MELVEPPAGAQVGERLTVEGYDCTAPDAQLPPKKKIFEAVGANRFWLVCALVLPSTLVCAGPFCCAVP